jgi:hypothetical protein
MALTFEKYCRSEHHLCEDEECLAKVHVLKSS